MTHRNNYEYVKKWRKANRELNLLRARKYTLKSYYYKQAIKELYKIEPSLFL